MGSWKPDYKGFAAVLEVRHLAKSFGGITAINNLSFTLQAGERLVVLGPNGAGKTTLLQLLIGLLQPDDGEILLDGKSITRLSPVRRARLGLSPGYQQNNLFGGLSVGENLALAVAMGQRKTASVIRDSLRDRQVLEEVQRVADQVSLTGLLNQQVEAVSYSNRRQLEVGIALATRPKILLMDEPTSGVGAEMIDSFHRLFQSLPADLTMLIIAHDMDIAFSIADRLLVLHFGEKAFSGTPEQTRNSDLVQKMYLGK